MPKNQYISDLAENSMVDSVFLVLEGKLRTGSNGRLFCDIKLGDRTGEILVRIWNADEMIMNMFRDGRVVRIKGVKVTTFNGLKQIAFDSAAVPTVVSSCKSTEYEMNDLITATLRDRRALFKDLAAAIDGIENPCLKCLLKGIFTNKEFALRFSEWPAAIKHHHAYMGGLLEHTVGVLNICRAAAEFYMNVDKDLLYVGAILHDIGKLDTYLYSQTEGRTQISRDGVLLDHIIIGIIKLREYINTICSSKKRANCGGLFPPELLISLEHMILSHHGTKEWGSPVEPSTIEAVILHHADNADSKVNKIERLIIDRGIEAGNFQFVDEMKQNVYVSESPAAVFEHVCISAASEGEAGADAAMESEASIVADAAMEADAAIVAEAAMEAGSAMEADATIVAEVAMEAEFVLGASAEGNGDREGEAERDEKEAAV